MFLGPKMSHFGYYKNFPLNSKIDTFRKTFFKKFKRVDFHLQNDLFTLF